jgi:uncharacterized protein (DUF2141 family)
MLAASDAASAIKEPDFAFWRKLQFMISLLQSCFLLASLLFTTDTLEVRITNVSEVKGCVRMAVFASASDFEEEKNAVYEEVVPLSSTATIYRRLPLSGSSSYGIALYHDVNNNGKLDRNGLGIPKEPYAFSNNPAAKWQAPTFSEIAFVPNKVNGTLQLKLLAWGDR